MTDVISPNLSRLKDAVKGPVLHPGDGAYQAARTIFNMRFSGQPSTIVRVLDVDDVVAVTRHASENQIPFAIRSGGHGIDGFAMPDDALVIDTSLMKRIHVDPDTGIATLQAGALLGEMNAVLQSHGRVVPSGTVTTTGVTGLTLGGGIGFLMRRFGATVDNVVGAEMVTVYGRVVRASEDENADLFWALLGAGANLGVVTSLKFRTHDLGPQLSSGAIVYSGDDAPQVLRQFADYARTSPRELGLAAAMAPCPPLPMIPEYHHGSLVVLIIVCYTGDPARTDEVLAPLLGFGQPLANIVAPASWVQANSMLDVNAPHGHRAHERSGYLAELTGDVIDIVIDRLHSAPAPAGVHPHLATIFWPFGGAFSEDFDEDSKAFSREGANFLWGCAAEWDGPENDSTFSGFVDGVLGAVKPHLLTNSYINLTVDQGPDWRKKVYGRPSKFERVVAAKTAWDPHNQLRWNKNIEPAT